MTPPIAFLQLHFLRPVCFPANFPPVHSASPDSIRREFGRKTDGSGKNAIAKMLLVAKYVESAISLALNALVYEILNISIYVGCRV